MFLHTGLQDLGHATRRKSRTSMSYENTLQMNRISWISTSSIKPLEGDKRDFELVWLQETSCNALLHFNSALQ